MLKNQLSKLFRKSSVERIMQIESSKVEKNPYQPRKDFAEQDIINLASSIQEYGVIQPITVRKVKQGYQLIAGERRLRACILLGFKEIPAIVQEMDDAMMAAVSLVENLQRKELNYFEEAEAYRMIMDKFSITQEELAKKVGKSQSSIANKVRLLRLADEVKNLMIPEYITERHARAVLKLNSIETQKYLVKKIYEQELTVKETEELVEILRRHNIPKSKKTEEGGQQVSMLIKDSRIFLNTIKETVLRAKQIGIEIIMTEVDDEEAYEIYIKVPKEKNLMKSVS